MKEVGWVKEDSPRNWCVVSQAEAKVAALAQRSGQYRKHEGSKLSLQIIENDGK